MSHGWNSERRARQAELIRNWKPWNRATGPKSLEGKAKSSKNSYKNGEYTKEALNQMRELKELINFCKGSLGKAPKQDEFIYD